MGMDAGTLLESLSQVLTKYPEVEFQQRAVHFAFSQRGRRWLFEGEDRARFFSGRLALFTRLSFFGAS